jgi:hypothetical protein
MQSKKKSVAKMSKCRTISTPTTLQSDQQECYIFCFIETCLLAQSYTYVYLLYIVVLLVAYLLKNLLYIDELLILTKSDLLIK